MRRALGQADGFAGQGDAIYEALLEAHSGLDDSASLALNARLVLLLANAVGEPETVRRLIAEAVASMPSGRAEA